MKKVILASLLVLAATGVFSDPPDTHGMLLFGKKSNYISHLPMFHSPHDYQVIAQVEMLNKGSEQTLAKYEEAKKKQTLFTLVPELMDLSKVVSGEITSFGAIIYKGHFERGGTPIGSVKVNISKKIIGEKIAKGKGASLEFKCFGHDDEYFVAHMIKGQPTYDAIYASSKPYTWSFPHCGRAGCPDPVKIPLDQNALPVVINANNPQFGISHPQDIELGDPQAIQVEINKPLYVEYKELAH